MAWDRAVLPTLPLAVPRKKSRFDSLNLLPVWFPCEITYYHLCQFIFESAPIYSAC